MTVDRKKPAKKQLEGARQHSGSYRGRQKALRIPTGRRIDTEVAIVLIGLLVRATHPSRLDWQLDRLCQRVAEQFELGESDETARLAIAARIDRHRKSASEMAQSGRPPEPLGVVEQHEVADCVGIDPSKSGTSEIGV